MISRRSRWIFGFGVCGLCACTLTEPAYQPLHVDSAGSPSGGATTIAAGAAGSTGSDAPPTPTSSAGQAPASDGTGAYAAAQASMSASAPLAASEPSSERPSADAGAGA